MYSVNYPPYFSLAKTLIVCLCQNVTLSAVYKATVEEGNVITAFLLLMGINVVFAIIASAFIVIEV